jgi:hypothetical protein
MFKFLPPHQVCLICLLSRRRCPPVYSRAALHCLRREKGVGSAPQVNRDSISCLPTRIVKLSFCQVGFPFAFDGPIVQLCERCAGKGADHTMCSL